MFKRISIFLLVCSILFTSMVDSLSTISFAINAYDASALGRYNIAKESFFENRVVLSPDTTRDNMFQFQSPTFTQPRGNGYRQIPATIFPSSPMENANIYIFDLNVGGKTDGKYRQYFSRALCFDVRAPMEPNIEFDLDWENHGIPGAYNVLNNRHFDNNQYNTTAYKEIIKPFLDFAYIATHVVPNQYNPDDHEDAPPILRLFKKLDRSSKVSYLISAQVIAWLNSYYPDELNKLTTPQILKVYAYEVYHALTQFNENQTDSNKIYHNGGVVNGKFLPSLQSCFDLVAMMESLNKGKKWAITPKIPKDKNLFADIWNAPIKQVDYDFSTIGDYLVSSLDYAVGIANPATQGSGRYMFTGPTDTIPIGALDAEEYQYRFYKADGNQLTRNMQRLLIPFYTKSLGAKVEKAEVWIALKKVDDRGTGLRGAKFKINYHSKFGSGSSTLVSDGNLQYIKATIIYDSKDKTEALNAPIEFGIVELSAPSGMQPIPAPIRVVATAKQNGKKNTALLVNGDGSIVNTGVPIPPPPPNVNIYKIDKATGALLAGAVLEFTRIGGGDKSIPPIKLITTNEGIKFQSNDPTDSSTYLPPGQYAVKEVQPPLGYYLDDHNVYNFEVSDTGDFIGEAIVFRNSREKTIELFKQSPNGEGLGGAIFDGYFNGSKFGSFTTDVDGYFQVSNLKEGYYHFVEVKPPTGYELPDPDYTSLGVFVNAADGNSTYYLNSINHKLKTVALTKSSPEGQALDGAVFEISHNGTSLGKHTTVNGQIVLTDQKSGTYIFKEITPPKGYVLPPADELVTILHIDKITPINNFNVEVVNYDVPNIVINKVDSEGNPLANVNFEIKIDNTTFGTRLTDVNGSITISHDEFGQFISNHNLAYNTQWTVTATELDVPKGYLQSIPNHQTITVAKGQKEGEFEFVNYKIPSIKIHKLTPEGSFGFKTLKGAEFEVIIDGKPFSKLMTDANGQINITSDQFGNFIRTNGLENRQSWTITAVETNSPIGYLKSNPTKETIVLTREQEFAAFTFINYQSPEFKIKKVVDDGISKSSLNGAQFEVIIDGLKFGSFLTDDKGEILINSSKFGDFLLKHRLDERESWDIMVRELNPPSGYVKSSPDSQHIVLFKGETYREVIFTNKKSPELIIKKVDSSNNQSIEGAKFDIYVSKDRPSHTSNALSNDGSTSKIGSFFTDKNGIIHLDSKNNLQPGWYIVDEVGLPKGYDYHPEEGKTTYVHLEGNEIYTHTVRNVPQNSLVIYKEDSNNNRLLSGAIFELFDKDHKPLRTYETDSSGKVEIQSLVPEVYYIKETQAPYGYLLDEEEKRVELVANKPTVVRIKNKPLSGLLIHTIDATTKKPIQGAEFLISDTQNKPVGKYLTDNLGQIMIQDLKSGTYILREIKAPNGYVVDNKDRTIQISFGKTTTVYVENQPQLAQIIIKTLSKADSKVTGIRENLPLSGAVFNILNMKTKEVVSQVITEKDGVAMSKPLPLGEYLVQELYATKNYAKDGKDHEVILSHSNQTYQLTVYNKPLYIELDILLKGAKEAITNSQIMYTISEVANNSTVALDNFFVRDIVPYQNLKVDSISTGIYNHSQMYDVFVETTQGRKIQIAGNLTTQQNHKLNFKLIDLNNGEQITNILLIFGQVAPDFKIKTPIQLYGTVSTNQYQDVFTNKVIVGGTFENDWVTEKSEVKTKLWNKNGAKTKILPNTGY